MEYKQFRDSGELSDFTVYVDSERFKLHKFPLYTKSDYFKDLAGSNPVCQLTEFPGGSATFGLIADFCYAKDVEITPENVVFLHAAADLLKMRGKQNMYEITGRYIKEIFDEAECKTKLQSLIIILCSASIIKSDLAEKLYDDSLALLDSLWLRDCNASEKFPPRRRIKANELDRQLEEDSYIADFIIYLPLSAFLKIIKDARERSVSETIISALCAKYLARVLKYWTPEPLENRRSQQNVGENNLESLKNSETNFSNSNNSSICSLCVIPTKVKQEEDLEIEKFYKTFNELSTSLQNALNQFEKVLEIIPDPAELKKFITIEWVQKENIWTGHILNAYTIVDQTLKYVAHSYALALTDLERNRNQCRPKILKLANKMLENFKYEDLVEFTPATLSDILSAYDNKTEIHDDNISLSRRTSKRGSTLEGLAENQETDSQVTRRRSSAREPQTSITPKIADSIEELSEISIPESVTPPVVKFMSKMTDDNKLTVAEYMRLLRKLTVSQQNSSLNDELVEVLQKLAKCGQKLSEQDTNEVLKHISLNNCSTKTLNGALEADLFPPKAIAEAAINVAKQNEEKNLSAPKLSEISGTSESYCKSDYPSPLYNIYRALPPMRGRSRCPDLLHSKFNGCKNLSTEDRTRSCSVNPYSTLRWRKFEPIIIDYDYPKFSSNSYDYYKNVPFSNYENGTTSLLDKSPSTYKSTSQPLSSINGPKNLFYSSSYLY